jgi:hypothetical protein
MTINEHFGSVLKATFVVAYFKELSKHFPVTAVLNYSPEMTEVENLKPFVRTAGTE